MSTTTSESSSSLVTAYDPDIRFFATRYSQGGRQVLAIDLSLTQIAALLPAPDPQKPTEGNRRVKESHAAAFGDYIRSQDEWVSPALEMRAPNIFTFETREEVAGTQFGVLSFPHLAKTDLKILDGQHRILGIHRAIGAIAEELAEKRSGLAAARKNGADPAVMAHFERAIDELNEQRERFDRERISVQIYVEEDAIAYKQMFVDIADNALGISGAVRVRFDNRKVVNRAIEGVMKHALVAGKVDEEQDRIGRNNANLLGAKHLAEIIRAVAVGIDGRVGRRLENELREDALIQDTNEFFDALVEGFPDLADVADDTLSPPDLRAKSLLGSTSVLRVLAGVYHKLKADEHYPDEDIPAFFAQLAPHSRGPVTEDSIWIEHGPPEVFTVGALAPKARRQDLKALTDTLVSWAQDEPAWLGASSAA
jgi:hypothetical protein